MPSPVSVIIPTLNEEEWIAGAVESAIGAGAAEVVVVDGGSADRTARFATAAGARVLLAERMRARQLNRGVQAASNESLIILHADSRLPAGAAAAVHDALQRGALFGAFRLRFLEPAWRLRVAAFLINVRSIVLRGPWGDQAHFIARQTLLHDGGFREIPILEDYELALRMKRAGRTTILPLTVTTSGRRFLQKGVLRTAATNWRIIYLYRRGTDAAQLARIYRS
jgi:rSAM/selenodomain-associated transferase 2